jgi:hypothetical protein
VHTQNAPPNRGTCTNQLSIIINNESTKETSITYNLEITKMQLNDIKQKCILSREKGALADEIPIFIYLY